MKTNENSVTKSKKVFKNIDFNDFIGIILSALTRWPVGETVNSHAFHACIHGFESRTGHHIFRKQNAHAF
jgi:hypothetical protein